MKVLGIIPARGGSRRVPKKNIRLLAGEPLILYTIEAALKSKHINRLIVSTDDPEIAKVAEEYGAEVPFLRPASLAQDDTPDQPVFQHALESLKEHDGYEPDIVVHLRPTTPLKTPQTIDKVIEKMRETKADIVRTMTPVEGVHHPYWMYSLSENGRTTPIMKNIKVSEYYQSQLLPPVNRISCVADAMKASLIHEGVILDSNNMIGVVTSLEESIDIDTDFDFLLAECLLQMKVKEWL